jgi:hypothetical protein
LWTTLSQARCCVSTWSTSKQNNAMFHI